MFRLLACTAGRTAVAGRVPRSRRSTDAQCETRTRIVVAFGCGVRRVTPSCGTTVSAGGISFKIVKTQLTRPPPPADRRGESMCHARRTAAYNSIAHRLTIKLRRYATTVRLTMGLRLAVESLSDGAPQGHDIDYSWY